MGFSKDFMHNHHCPMAITSTEQPKGEDVFDSNTISDVVDMKDWGACLFIVKKLDGAVGTATATVEACSNAAAAATTAVTFYYRSMTTADTWATEWATSASLSITAGADEIWEIMVFGDQLVSDRHYVRLKLTEVDSTAVDGSIQTILLEPRYAKPSTSVDSVLD